MGFEAADAGADEDSPGLEAAHGDADDAESLD